MGMFYLAVPDKQSNTIFPPGVEDRICIDFTCKGCICLAEGYTLMHPCWPKDMANDDVEAIAKHFKATTSGWLSSIHFANLSLSPEAEAIFVPMVVLYLNLIE